jgi:hypothetical protein
MATYLHDNHGRTKRICSENPHPDAGHPAGRATRPLVICEAGKEILVPYPADRMKAWPVSSRVNSPKNDDSEIIVPVEL